MTKLYVWVAALAALGCDEDPLELRAAAPNECNGSGGVVLSEGDEEFFACNGEPGEPGRDGVAGEPGAMGEMGAADNPPGLGDLRGFVECELVSQSSVNDPYTQRAKTWFFASGWTFASAALSTAEDDESQSDFVPSGENPFFSFQGLPLLAGTLSFEMDLALEELRISQDASVLERLPWSGPNCLDGRQ